MVNTSISDISEGGIALGENKYTEGQLLDEAIRAGEVVIMTATGIALHNYDSIYLGIMKEHEEFDLDTDITAAKYGDVITEGYVAVFITNPGATKYPGTFLYKGAGGTFGFTATGEVFAILKRTVVSGIQ